MAITTREGRTQTTLAEINMIPFIDIVLVLLIIFMVTAPVIQSGIAPLNGHASRVAAFLFL